MWVFVPGCVCLQSIKIAWKNRLFSRVNIYCSLKSAKLRITQRRRSCMKWLYQFAFHHMLQERNKEKVFHILLKCLKWHIACVKSIVSSYSTSIKPYDAEAEIFREKYVSARAADDLVHVCPGHQLLCAQVIRRPWCACVLQYIPRNMHTDFALLCFVVVIHWLIFPYPSGLLHWHCGNLTIAPVPAKQPWWIWINTSCEFIMNDCITTKKQSTTKPCAYFLGYTVYKPGLVFQEKGCHLHASS